MKKLKLLMMSCFILTFISCSDENNLKNENLTEAAATSNNASTRKTPTQENCSFAKVQVGPADNLYNCHGLSFVLSEKYIETKEKIDLPGDVYTRFIQNEIFVEDSSSNATKVIYWNNLTNYKNRDFIGVDHSAIIVEGDNIVYSKQGANQVFKNCINDVYLAGTHYYRTYALNLALNPYETNPTRKVPFIISAAHDASSILDVQYSWDADPADYKYLRMIGNGSSCSFEFKGEAPSKAYTFTLKAKHQRGKINGTAFEKIATKSVTINLTGTPEPIPTASFTGSTYVTKTSMGSWSATASGGTAPYQFTWWIKRQEEPDSFYLQIATGPGLYLLTKTSIKSTYYTLYVRVVDANGQSFSTQPMVVQSTGVLEEAY
ncbi:hypothetical protein PQ462_00270 [Flavobacterium sp. KACC 22758]|uniref:hypothetical protein n=1 Tax=Flavobacterium sp. KACC 22758 TaxID=3025667 RepID=UPI0023657AEE|nr:hypothetical protein [Flavobacterium sp. KACC 22758]WDF59815.1 hypothetical protein PQ462_00270 [Flavobacterium sp. KACC 22758]